MSSTSPLIRLGTAFRARRSRRLKARIEALAAQNGGQLNVLDLGGSAGYWQRLGFDWMRAHGVKVMCVNYDESELPRGASGDIPIKLEIGDARALTRHADNSFDLVHSNSVIEHVGRWADMVAFASETRRLAPAYYVQTPYFWFPVDPHFFRVPFFHWLPVGVRAKLLKRFKVGWAKPSGDINRAMTSVQSSDILDRTQFRALFPDGRHRFEWAGPLPKSMIVER